jgi:hypothetical protein
MNYLKSLALAILCAAVATQQARQSFAVGYLLGSDGMSGDLVLINTDDGSSSVIGNMPGVGSGVGLAYNPNTNTLYTRNSDTLFTVDVRDASTTVVGPSGSTITSLAFSTDYATLYSVGHVSGDFFNVDPATGAATLIGNTGMDVPLDLAMSSSGVLWATDINARIYTIDPATGAATLAFPFVTPQGLTSIEFDRAGNLYGVTLIDNMLLQIDLTDGSTSLVGGPIVTSDIRGMAYVPGVPEPAVCMLLLIGYLAALAVHRSPRHR